MPLAAHSRRDAPRLAPPSCRGRLGAAPLTAALAHLRRPGRVFEQLRQRRGELPRMVPLDQQPVVAVGHQLRQPPMRVATTGSPASTYSSTDSGQPSNSEQQTATSMISSRSGMSVVRSPSSHHRLPRPRACSDLLLQPGSLRTVTRDQHPYVTEPFPDGPGGLNQHRQSLLHPQHAHGADHRYPGVDPQLGAQVAAAGRRWRWHAVRDHDDLRGVDALDIDHPPAVDVRDGDEGVGAPRHHVAIDEAAQGPALRRTTSARARRPPAWRARPLRIAPHPFDPY